LSPDPELSEQRVSTLARKIFPPGGAGIEWSKVLELVEEGEDICIRVTGGFDDREASIDSFLSSDLLRRLSPRTNP
jgi:hypothetical protein